MLRTIKCSWSAWSIINLPFYNWFPNAISLVYFEFYMAYSLPWRILLFQPSSGTSSVTAAAVAAAGETSLDRVEKSENKMVSSSLSSPVTSSLEASGGRESAGIHDDRERLTFHIALGESGFASLGISVTKVFHNRRDCGIFIKSVRIGGMAAKVCEAVVLFSVGSRALCFSDPYIHFACLSVLPSFVLSFVLSCVLSVRNFRAKYLGNEAR